MSSIRAMGQTTQLGAPFRVADPPHPGDSYGRTKLAIERALVALALQSGLELVIVRPPLVYGPGAKGNLRTLIRVVATGLPLPFAAIDNRRSLISVDNLADLTATACFHPAAGGQLLLARDAHDLSTPGLICALAAGFGRPARLFAVPRGAFAILSRFPAVGPAISILTSSLQVEDGETRRTLDWFPVISPEAGLAAAARAYARER